MAAGATHKAKASKKNRKYNRNRDKCKLYRARGVRERNKARKLARHERWMVRKAAHLAERAAHVTA